MKAIIRRNERSWAIEIISQINEMLKQFNLEIKRAGGETTLSVDKKSMFPDVLLYGDIAQNKILQGWELKMPDVSITDEAFIKDAERKAAALGLNSYVIWNFTYGKLYVKDTEGKFREAKIWIGTDHIRTREDVITYKSEWIPLIRDIILTVNEYLLRGEITAASIVETVSDNLMTEVIQRNKDAVAEGLEAASRRSMRMESQMKVWWNDFREEYDRDETNMYSAYAKSILLNWTNRIMFANLIKKYHNCAYLIENIDNASTPTAGNEIIDQIIAQGDFYNIFRKLEYNEIIPEDTWIDIVDYNQFLCSHNLDSVNQTVLQNILEKTVNVAKREIRGQYATPYYLADILCQITVDDWNGEIGDTCAGTGTIAKAIIDNKMMRLKSPEAVFSSTWISDKHAYPLQIANLAIASIQALNIPLNLFQKDVFEAMPGQEVEIKSPTDGQAIKKKIPKFDAIVSNLPFVKYNNIAVDEIAHIEKCRQLIYANTGIEFTQGKTDLYNFVPFKMHELLAEKGRLGIILSNSWLGTDVGQKFFKALQFYYHIKTVVLSNCGRWFENADVVATLLVLEKKEISAVDDSEEVNFCLINKNIKNLSAEDQEAIVNSLVLGKEINPSLVTIRKYSLKEISIVQKYGITMNVLFQDITWLHDIAGHIIPVGEVLEVKRGERRGWNELFYPEGDNEIEKEYICPVLKTPSHLKGFVAHTDIKAFCCNKSKEELAEAGHFGALAWIEKFENITNGIGKPLPFALKRAGFHWYEMDDSAKADFVTAINPDKRLFVAKFDESTFVDQRFTRLLKKREDISLDLIHALLNSIYGMFAIEAVGFGRGLGVLDARSTKIKNMFMINPKDISDKDADEIIKCFRKIRDRDVMDTDAEVQDPKREQFDRVVLRAVGCEHLYPQIKKSLLEMQHTRHAVKDKEL